MSKRSSKTFDKVSEKSQQQSPKQKTSKLASASSNSELSFHGSPQLRAQLSKTASRSGPTLSQSHSPKSPLSKQLSQINPDDADYGMVKESASTKELSRNSSRAEPTGAELSPFISPKPGNSKQLSKAVSKTVSDEDELSQPLSPSSLRSKQLSELPHKPSVPKDSVSQSGTPLKGASKQLSRIEPPDAAENLLSPATATSRQLSRQPSKSPSNAGEIRNSTIPSEKVPSLSKTTSAVSEANVKSARSNGPSKQGSKAVSKVTSKNTSKAPSTSHSTASKRATRVKNSVLDPSRALSKTALSTVSAASKPGSALRNFVSYDNGEGDEFEDSSLVDNDTDILKNTTTDIDGAPKIISDGKLVQQRVDNVEILSEVNSSDFAFENVANPAVEHDDFEEAEYATEEAETATNGKMDYISLISSLHAEIERLKKEIGIRDSRIGGLKEKELDMMKMLQAVRKKGSSDEFYKATRICLDRQKKVKMSF
ncbi:hypothetical protein HDU82_008713 [Entophlyctis luteolus]|nr:hypothetical protein HDU82_008713 [Entophlyctis luteolus]